MTASTTPTGGPGTCAVQEATPDGVRQEVRHLIDTFDRPEGGLCLSAGNPFENIEAFLDEALRYGDEHRLRFAT